MKEEHFIQSIYTHRLITTHINIHTHTGQPSQALNETQTHICPKSIRKSRSSQLYPQIPVPALIILTPLLLFNKELSIMGNETTVPSMIKTMHDSGSRRRVIRGALSPHTHTQSATVHMDYNELLNFITTKAHTPKTEEVPKGETLPTIPFCLAMVTPYPSTPATRERK